MRLAHEVWSLLDRRQRRVLLGMLSICVVAAFSTVGGVAAVVPFMAFLADSHLLEGHAAIAWLQDALGIARREDMLLVLGGGFVAAVMLSSCISLVAMVAAEKFSHAMAGSLQMRLFEHYLRQDCGFHAATGRASLSANLLQEVYRLTLGVIYSGLMLVTQGISSLLIIGFVVAIDPLAALTAVSVLGGAYLLTYLVVRSRLASHGRDFTREWHERARLIDESLGAVKEILLMRNQAYFTRRFALHTRRIGQAKMGIAAISQSPRFILETMTVICLVAAALWSSRAHGSGGWLVQLSLLGMAAYRLLPALQQSFAHSAKIRANSSALERIAQDLRNSVLARQEHHLPADPAWRRRPRRGVAVREVTYRYAPSRPPALRDISLEIPAGSLVALVGPNGSGKTTLADMILGLLRPQQGRVEIDGIVLDETNIASWHAAVACVPQNTFLLNASLVENIALGIARPEVDDARLSRAVELANLQDLVATLPRRLEEPLGDRGLNLSGGQKQRVGIARALYREPSLLVLDEATGALDDAAEHAFVDVLAELRGSCTIVLIAHRASSLRHCDFVFELDRGAIARSSLHREWGARRDRTPA